MANKHDEWRAAWARLKTAAVKYQVLAQKLDAYAEVHPGMDHYAAHLETDANAALNDLADAAMMLPLGDD